MTRAGMLLTLGRFVLIGWRFRLRPRGGDYGPEIGRRETVRRVTKRTAFFENGYKIFVNRRRDGKTLSIHKIFYSDPVPDLGCNAEIEKAYAALTTEFGKDGIRNGGIYNCRNIDGTSTRSYHGYVGSGWKGAACDVFSNPDSMQALYRRAYFLVDETKAGRLALDSVIVGNTVWTRRDRQWHPYHGVFHRHVHMEHHAGGPC